MLTSMRHSCCTHQLAVPVANCPRHAQSHTSQHPNIEGGGTRRSHPWQRTVDNRCLLKEGESVSFGDMLVSYPYLCGQPHTQGHMDSSRWTQGSLNNKNKKQNRGHEVGRK